MIIVIPILEEHLEKTYNNYCSVSIKIIYVKLIILIKIIFAVLDDKILEISEETLKERSFQ
ncbi:hypothetical protein [Butyrivibrio sp. NC2002]|uniref:hypothetical protein n=1 Tax=Butyrivibrio sp. NC2002 TaxID=1410610 RepID=UPI00055C2E71|nr:hypothetical protein [Butyrivibrio sp. NC2002]